MDLYFARELYELSVNGSQMELDQLEYYQERRLKDLGLCGEQGEIIFWEPK